MKQAKTSVYCSRTLLALLAVGVLAIGLLVLVGAKQAWAASRTFVPAPGSPIAVGSTPTTVTNADFNGDGKMDLAAQNSGSNSVSVRLGNGDGTFVATPDITVGSSPTSVIDADLNDDGKADLAVTNYSSGTVSVLRGNGDGTFQAKQDFQAGSSPNSVIDADLNRDGFTDLAIANYGSDKVSVLLGQDTNGDGKADGTFQTAGAYSIDRPCSGVCIPSTTGPNQVITGNFNGDSAIDLATANTGNCPFFCTPGGVSVLLGNGNGTFQDARLPLTGTAIYSIDANGSGDIMAANWDSNSISVLRSNGNGTFSSGPQLPVVTNPSAVTSEDLDGDGAEDLAVSNFGSNNVSVLINNGSGSFGAAQNFPAGTGPAFVIGARLNADTFADLAVANQNSNNVSVLLNTAVAPETTITSRPPSYAKSTSAGFSFTSSVANSTFKCSLDGSSYTVCTSPNSYSSLAQGSHTFRVKAIDEAGNADLTPAKRTWFVDTVAPEGTISINDGSASTSSRSVTLTLAARDPSPASGVASMRFRNGGTTTWSAWSANSTSKPWTLSAGAGAKTVYVQYRDRARNVSASASDTIQFNP